MKKLLLVALLLAMFGLVSSAAPETTKTTETEEAGNDVQDVLYLGEGRPALIRLHLRTNGISSFKAWDGFTEKLFEYLDKNKSGGLDRVEGGRALSAQQLLQYYSGNLVFVADGRGTAKVSFETLDADRDGKVTLDELRDYYRKNGAGPVLVQANSPYGNPYVRGGYYGGDSTGSSDRLFTLLDADKDGKLSQKELTAGEKLLARYDNDDNELVSQNEIGGNPVNPYMVRPVGGPVVTRPAQPSTMMLLPRTEGGSRSSGKLTVARDIITRQDKDKDGKLTLEESGFPKAAFGKIDRNGDGKLDVLELSRWIGGKPEGEFVVRLGTVGGMMAPPPRRGGGKMPAPVVPSKDEMSLTLGNVRIAVRPMNVGTPYDFAGYLLGQFRLVDEEKKGYILRRQLNAQTHYYLNATFEVADANGDGRLSEAELRAFAGIFKEAYGKQLTLALNPTGQGLFQALDTNGDGQLSLRELRGAWKQLESFDADKDGCISREEFPQQFAMTVSQSAAGYYAGVGFVGGGMGMGTPRTVSTRGPLWFRKMDRNGDGDVSPTEWLGSKEDFAKIDTDKDGLISVDEADTFDAKSRKTE